LSFGGANPDRTGDLYNAIVKERRFLGSSEDFRDLLSDRFIKEFGRLTIVEVGLKLLAFPPWGFRGASVGLPWGFRGFDGTEVIGNKSKWLS
jgi:hypothetical protein